MTSQTVMGLAPNEETAAVIAWLKERPAGTKGSWEIWLLKIRTHPKKMNVAAIESDLMNQLRHDLYSSFGMARALVEATRHRIDTNYIARALLADAGIPLTSASATKGA